MSTYNTFIRIKNGFPAEMTDGTANITEGTLSKELPKIIKPSATTSEIEVDGLNSEDGSAGSFAYNVVIGGHTRQIFVKFVCNDAVENFATVESSIPSLIDVDITPYSPIDHPLRATVTISLAKRQ